MKPPPPSNNVLPDRHVQVAVTLQDVEGGNNLSIDPWDNCPSAEAREEGRYCNECEHWGREVKAVDWSEFSVCLLGNEE